MSQKKLFAKASKSYSQGNILESARYYKKLLDIGFTDPNIFNNYGSICKQLGQTEQAISQSKTVTDSNEEATIFELSLEHPQEL